MITKNKKDLELVTKEIEKKSFISYVLPDHVWCNTKYFLSYSKKLLLLINTSQIMTS